MPTTWSSTNNREKDVIKLTNSSLINTVLMKINQLITTRTVWTDNNGD